MAKSPQWNVKGVDDAARVVARDAAAKAGLPMGAWIDRAVKRAAREEANLVVPRSDRAADTPQSAGPESSSLIERAIDHGAVGRPADAPPFGSAPEPSVVPFPPVSRGGGSSRGIRIAVAIAIMAVLTGGAMWLLNDQFGTPPQLGKPDAPAKVATAAKPEESSTPPATTAPPVAAPAPETDSIEALTKSAQAGDARTQYELGIRYATGHDVARDDAQAARWFEKAAVQGMASAQYNLGVLYDRGLGVKQDDTLAFFWYQSAAEQGNARAQHNLATAYADGKGTSQDFAEAAKWFEKAAAAGIPESQFYLGALYERGMGVGRDLPRALAMYRLAANQGNKEAAERVAALGSLPGVGKGSDATPTPVAASPVAAKGAAPLPRATVAEIQRLLARLDFDPGPADGVMGKKTVDAISAYQTMAGMPADGKPSADLLDDLRQVAGAAKR